MFLAALPSTVLSVAAITELKESKRPGNQTSKQSMNPAVLIITSNLFHVSCEVQSWCTVERSSSHFTSLFHPSSRAGLCWLTPLIYGHREMNEIQ